MEKFDTPIIVCSGNIGHGMACRTAEAVSELWDDQEVIIVDDRACDEEEIFNLFGHGDIDIMHHIMKDLDDMQAALDYRAFTEIPWNPLVVPPVKQNTRQKTMRTYNNRSPPGTIN